MPRRYHSTMKGLNIAMKDTMPSDSQSCLLLLPGRATAQAVSAGAELSQVCSSCCALEEDLGEFWAQHCEFSRTAKSYTLPLDSGI